MLCGGVSNTTVDDKVKKMVADFKGEVESQLNETFAVFNPIEATQQVVGNWIRVDLTYLGCRTELSCEGGYR